MSKVVPLSVASTRPISPTVDEPAFVFRLYVAGEAPHSTLALRNLKALCLARYADDCRIELVDVLLSPERAWADGVIATPTTVRVVPAPQVRLVGNLSNTEQVLRALGLPGEGHD